MIDADKKQFQYMLNTVMQVYNKPKLSKEVLIAWWSKLHKYEVIDIRVALDRWIDEGKFAPTISDIVELCPSHQPIYVALPPPVSLVDNKRHADEVKQAVTKMVKPRHDYRAWAKKIIDNPAHYPDISLRLAQEALKAPMVTQ